jgi:serine/threonine protein kinase
MGEVYRARDSRLRRDVALKILPEPLASDPERQARFEREATTLASLNHPTLRTFTKSRGVTCAAHCRLARLRYART